VRSFYGIRPGERFAALITDIKPDRLTITFDNGEKLTAKYKSAMGARIGDYCVFVVKKNDFKGKISLEIEKDGLSPFDSFDMRV